MSNTDHQAERASRRGGRAARPTSAAYSPEIDGESWYDLGELAQLVSRLYGQGEPIALIPFLRKTDRRMNRKVVWLIWTVTALFTIWVVAWVVAVELGKAGH